jgi:hypothetical protein
MKLKIVAIRDAGDPHAERLVLRVTAASADIGQFAVFRAESSEASVTNKVSNTFWFPDGSGREGDRVVLYTKRGVQQDRVNKTGSTSHFYYWGLERPIWGTKEFVAVIVHIDEWASTIKLLAKEAEQDIGEP